MNQNKEIIGRIADGHIRLIRETLTDGSKVYETETAAADEDLRTWEAMLAAWRRINGMDNAEKN
jgi:hypothetical protein